MDEREGKTTAPKLSDGKAWGCIALWAAMAILVPAVLLLPYHVAWPQSCVPSQHGRGRLAEMYLCSPGLLEGGGREILLFLILWVPATVIIGLGLWRLGRSFWNARI